MSNSEATVSASDADLMRERNNELESLDCAAWNTKPKHFIGYLRERYGLLKFETWAGTPLGVITWRHLKEYSLFGIKHTKPRLHVQVKGNNGSIYYGSCYHNYDRMQSNEPVLIRLRRTTP